MRLFPGGCLAAATGDRSPFQSAGPCSRPPYQSVVFLRRRANRTSIAVTRGVWTISDFAREGDTIAEVRFRVNGTLCNRMMTGEGL